MRKFIFITIAFILFSSSDVNAELYKYVDENGILVITDNINRVPESQRPDTTNEESVSNSSPSVNNNYKRPGRLNKNYRKDPKAKDPKDMTEKDVFGELNDSYGKSTIEALFSGNIDLHARSRRGESFLHGASSRGLTEVVSYLISNGLDVNAETPEGLTPLIEAANKGHVEVIELLLSAGADINAATSVGGFTSLMAAVSEDHTEAAKVLISSGADFNVSCDFFGRTFTPLSMADAKGNDEIKEFLLLNGAKKPIGYEDTRFSTPENTWQLYRKALIKGDTALALKCFTIK